MGQAGALDDLMGLCLVPVIDDRAGARTFTVSRVWETPSGQRRRRKSSAQSRKPMFAAIAMTTAFAAMAFAWRTVRHSKAEVPATPAHVDERALVRQAPPAPPISSARTFDPPAAVPAAPVDRVKRGWLRVGGTALVGARVTADGTLVGYAPLALSLPVGVHVVVVTSKAGHVLVHKRLHLGEAETRLAPLRIIR
jgi:hypothetical protein